MTRYRRKRTKNQCYALYRTVMRNYARFFPRGVPNIFLAEWEALRALGKYGPSTYDAIRTGPVLPGRSYPPHKTMVVCAGCKGHFWHLQSQGPYTFCCTRCREAARLSAIYTAFPDYATLTPVTTALRLWCYTHNSIPRPPSEVAKIVIRSPEELMSNDLNTYFDERLALTTAQQDALRARIDTLLSRQLVRAGSILAGTTKKEWSPQQVRLFLGLLNKVVPDMTASMSLALTKDLDAPSSNFDPSKMSREQLETALARELSKDAPRQAPPPVIDAETLEPAATPRPFRNLPGNNPRKNKAAQ